MRHTQHSGFTLIELSIVLVIIGLVIGGVLVGKEMIRASELRGIVTQIEQYTTAVHAFKTKYNCLPGDCPNATQFWGQRANCNSSGYTTVYSPVTCNGNGNGILVNGTDAGSPLGDSTNEHVTFWQQLVNAGLISGNYTGTRDGSSYLSIVMGVNVPSVKNFASAVITATSETPNMHFYYNGGMYFKTGSLSSGAQRAEGGYLTVTEAQSLDGKFDDAKPMTGRMMETYWNSDPLLRCPASFSTTSTYAVGNAGSPCNLIFQAGF